MHPFGENPSLSLKELFPQIQVRSKYQRLQALSPCCMEADMPKSSGTECSQTYSQKLENSTFRFVSFPCP